MGAVLIGTPTDFEFANGNAGAVIDLGSAPAVGQRDVLCINSNTVVTSIPGFTQDEPAVTNQGAYIYSRVAAGGEGQTVTITTSGDHNTQVGWSRWANTTTLDGPPTSNTQTNGSAGNTTPAHNTGAIAAAGSLVIAFGALHSIGALADQNTPVWSAGYTPMTEGVQGSGATGVVGFTAYNDNAGTAAETPNVTWSGSGVQNAYMLTAVYGATAGADEIVDDEAPGALAGGSPAEVQSETVVEDDAPGALGGGSPASLEVDEVLDDVNPGALDGGSEETVLPHVSVDDSNPGALAGKSPTDVEAAGEIIYDAAIDPLLEDALDCLTAEMAATPDPPTYFRMHFGASFEASASQYQDECCEGVAWVRLVEHFLTDAPGSPFPEEAVGASSCSAYSIAVVLELGRARCAPVVGGSDDSIVTPDQWRELTRSIMADRAALVRAACCLRPDRADVIVGQYSPLETEGNCAGGVLQVTVRINNCDCL
jgi:hypothetical protein